MNIRQVIASAVDPICVFLRSLADEKLEDMGSSLMRNPRWDEQMNLKRRPVVPAKDKEVLLEFHCMANYESDTPWARETPYASYRERWLRSGQPSSFLSSLASSLEDASTIAQIWETEDGTAAAYVWVTFTEIEGYGIVMAEIRDIAVAESFRRQGIGTELLRTVEATARRNGAALLRSEAGIENVASDGLHKSCGFATCRVEYEKVLDRAALE